MKIRTNIKFLAGIAALIVCAVMLFGCAGSNKAPADGEYLVNITMDGGTGKASIASPAKCVVADGKYTVELVWSSPNYDYMIVDGETYYNENEGGNSTFTIPVADISQPLEVIGDTTAMSVPHEIEYTLEFELSDQTQTSDASESVSFSSLEKTGELELLYADQFSAEYYGDYKVISIKDGESFLYVPEGQPVPSGIPEGMVVLEAPLDRTYLVSTSAMDLVREAGALSYIRLSGTKESDWYVEEAAQAMADGTMIYAGKYSAPDYELIINEGCNLAVENTMILHKPDVKEKLEELGIPVIVERSSYETHPLGRLEWIKLYGVLFDTGETAEQYFNSQIEIIEPILEQEDTGVSAAFFAVNANGVINVRKPGDYISRMIGMAGGHYILDDILVEEENALSTMNMQMESFYSAAKDADVLIYNSTIEEELGSIDELLEKNELFGDFKAVKNGQVYCVGKNFFQQITGMGEFIQDLNKVFTGSGDDYIYLKKLK